MKKLFIADAEERSKNGPSPDSYLTERKFGDDGIKTSMSARFKRYGARTDDYSDYYRA